MPRLAKAGVVGADAVFSCLGPALEIYSRYERVEKPSGEVVTLREYLEHLWVAVSREALGTIFEGADATGFEEDARLTAMFLWTLSRGENGHAKGKQETTSTGHTLEYDAARKIAQGVGAHLERLDHVVQVKGAKARLLAVVERRRHLFGREGDGQRRRSQEPQPSMFSGLGQPDDQELAERNAPPLGKTALDRVHQSMLLFADGRSAALNSFLVNDGAGRDPRFWRLAQALSALYPRNSEEKRWIDGVLARKKGLGF